MISDPPAVVKKNFLYPPPEFYIMVTVQYCPINDRIRPVSLTAARLPAALLRRDADGDGRAAAGMRKTGGEMGKYLIVVDMQNDFIDGALGSKEAEGILPGVVEKVWGFDGKVIFTYDTHDENYLNTREGRNLPVPHCLEGTSGWRLPDELEKLRFTIGGMAFTKTSFSSKALAEYIELENRREPVELIELAGLCTDICVVSNALLLKTFLPEVEIAVDSACCAGSTPARHCAALETMRACQITVL
jgi:nicotinamidase-related amidase